MIKDAPTSNGFKKFNFPKLKRFHLNNFSLYTLKPTLEVAFDTEVFCLIGANGLGKSTFLSIINYALTGIVADPKRKFESVEEYYKYSHDFAKDYFTGRIKEHDRKTASIRVVLEINGKKYDFERGFFEPRELRNFTVFDLEEPDEIIIDTSNLAPIERQQEYEKQLTSDMGVNEFEQFVFLQHFVLSFDERRVLLFYQQRILEQSLFLAFGIDPEEASKVDTLRRDFDKADSLVRNHQWEISKIKGKIEDIEKLVEELSVIDDTGEQLVLEYKNLTELKDKALSNIEKIDNEIKDTTLRLADVTTKQINLRRVYSQIYSDRLRNTSHIKYNPLITNTLNDLICGVCGTEGEKVKEYIQSRLDSNQCPFCSSVLAEENSDDNLQKLQEIDEELATIKVDIEDFVTALDRLNKESEVERNNLSRASKSLNNFEKENNKILSFFQDQMESLDEANPLMEIYLKELKERQKKKEDQIKRRKAKRDALKKLQNSLEKQFSKAESEFIPLFRQLANSFLGIDLDIQMEALSAKGINLLLKLRGSIRRADHQLSESQKFFIDIALRMALAQFMSSEENKSCLFIDTPEGSLDIAYEKRAGTMLSQFIYKGNYIVMTANINTSQLLLSLAENCSYETMSLCLMTDWTQLSEVQTSEAGLFDKAYKDIHKKLNSDKINPT